MSRFLSPSGEMVDTLVSGASASRRVGSTPISGTRVQHYAGLFFLYVIVAIFTEMLK